MDGRNSVTGYKLFDNVMLEDLSLDSYTYSLGADSLQDPDQRRRYFGQQPVLKRSGFLHIPVLL